MISSVSNINFRGESVPVNPQDLINQPGKFTTTAPAADAAKAEAPADSFEKEGAPVDGEQKSKSHAAAIIGTVVGLLALAYIGLGVAVGKEKLVKVPEIKGQPLKFKEKLQNFFYAIGDSGRNLWNKIRGKKVEDIENKKQPDNVSPEGNKVPEGESKPVETKAPEENKVPEGENKPAETKAPEADKAPEGENKPAEGENK